MSNQTIKRTIIEVKGLEKSFNNLLVLKDITFSLDEGEILAILGPSGSGKTTLLKCLIGLEDFTSTDHSILINGVSRNVYLTDRRIAYVPQRYSNYPWLTVAKNIELGLIKQKKQSLDKGEIDSRVREIIETVGLAGFENFTIDKLSGGMQQRVAIGRALAQNADIIAFDEPFGALDFKIREKLQLLVKQLSKTILFVTHDIEEALFIADKIILLSKSPTVNLSQFEPHFRGKMDCNIKFDNDFVAVRKTIQEHLTRPEVLVEELRAIKTIRSYPLEQLLSYPMLDAVRNYIDEKKDGRIIFDLIDSNDDHSFQLGIMLLRSFKADNALTDNLIKKFDSPNLSNKSRFYLFHELTYRSTDFYVKEKLWRYVKENFVEYSSWEVAYFGGAEKTINACELRLQKPEHQHKKWVYLVSLAATYQKEAFDIIARFTNDADAFTSKVAQELIKQFNATVL